MRVGEVGAQSWFDVDENRNLKISVFPNPANGKLLIEGIDVVSVRIYNVLGQLVKAVRNTNEIPISDLPQGVYLLRITNAMGVSQTERITVTR